MSCIKVGDGEWRPAGPAPSDGSSDGLGTLLALGLILSLVPAFVGYSVAGSQDLNPWAGVGAGLLFSWLGVFGIYLYGRALKHQTTAPSRERDPGDRLRGLQQLLNDGLITQQEYDDRRRAALDAI